MRGVTIVTTCRLSLSLYSQQDDFRNCVPLSASCNFVSMKALLAVRGIDPIAPANKSGSFPVSLDSFVFLFFHPSLFLPPTISTTSDKTLVRIESLSSVSPLESYVDGSESPNTHSDNNDKGRTIHHNRLLDALTKEDTVPSFPLFIPFPRRRNKRDTRSTSQ